jgi:hypothetical protein
LVQVAEVQGSAPEDQIFEDLSRRVLTKQLKIYRCACPPLKGESREEYSHRVHAYALLTYGHKLSDQELQRLTGRARSAIREDRYFEIFADVPGHKVPKFLQPVRITCPPMVNESAEAYSHRLFAHVLMTEGRPLSKTDLHKLTGRPRDAIMLDTYFETFSIDAVRAIAEDCPQAPGEAKAIYARRLRARYPSLGVDAIAVVAGLTRIHVTTALKRTVLQSGMVTDERPARGDRQPGGARSAHVEPAAAPVAVVPAAVSPLRERLFSPVGEPTVYMRWVAEADKEAVANVVDASSRWWSTGARHVRDRLDAVGVTEWQRLRALRPEAQRGWSIRVVVNGRNADVGLLTYQRLADMTVIESVIAVPGMAAAVVATLAEQVQGTTVVISEGLPAAVQALLAPVWGDLPTVGEYRRVMRTQQRARDTAQAAAVTEVTDRMQQVVRRLAGGSLGAAAVSPWNERLIAVSVALLPQLRGWPAERPVLRCQNLSDLPDATLQSRALILLAEPGSYSAIAGGRIGSYLVPEGADDSVGFAHAVRAALGETDWPSLVGALQQDRTLAQATSGAQLLLMALAQAMVTDPSKVRAALEAPAYYAPPVTAAAGVGWPMPQASTGITPAAAALSMVAEEAWEEGTMPPDCALEDAVPWVVASLRQAHPHPLAVALAREVVTAVPGWPADYALVIRQAEEGFALEVSRQGQRVSPRAAGEHTVTLSQLGVCDGQGDPVYGHPEHPDRASTNFFSALIQALEPAARRAFQPAGHLPATISTMAATLRGQIATYVQAHAFSMQLRLAGMQIKQEMLEQIDGTQIVVSPIRGPVSPSQQRQSEQMRGLRQAVAVSAAPRQPWPAAWEHLRALALVETPEWPHDHVLVITSASEVAMTYTPRAHRPERGRVEVRLVQQDSQRYTAALTQREPMQDERDDSFLQAVLSSVDASLFDRFSQHAGPHAPLDYLRQAIATTLREDPDYFRHGVLVPLVPKAEPMEAQQTTVPGDDRAVRSLKRPADRATPEHAVVRLYEAAAALRVPGQWAADWGDLMPPALVRSTDWPADIALAIHTTGMPPQIFTPPGYVHSQRPTQVHVFHDPVAQHYTALREDGPIPIPADGDCFLHAVVASLEAPMRTALIERAGPYGYVGFLRHAMAQALLADPDHFMAWITSEPKGRPADKRATLEPPTESVSPAAELNLSAVPMHLAQAVPSPARPADEDLFALLDTEHERSLARMQQLPVTPAFMPTPAGMTMAIASPPAVSHPMPRGPSPGYAPTTDGDYTALRQLTTLIAQVHPDRALAERRVCAQGLLDAALVDRLGQMLSTASATAAATALKEQAGRDYVQVLTALVEEKLLPAMAVFDALTTPPMRLTQTRRPSYLYALAHQVNRYISDARAGQALAELLLTLDRHASVTEQRAMRAALLRVQGTADFHFSVNGKYADFWGRLVNDGKLQHLPEGVSLAMAKLGSSLMPSQREIQAVHSSARAKKYAYAAQAAAAWANTPAHQALLAYPGPDLATVYQGPIATDLNAMQASETAAQTQAASDRRRHTAMGTVQEMVRAILDRDWASLMARESHKLEPDWLALVLDPMTSSAYATAAHALRHTPLTERIIEGIVDELADTPPIKAYLAGLTAVAPVTPELLHDAMAGVTTPVIARAEQAAREQVSELTQQLLARNATQAAQRAAEQGSTERVSQSVARTVQAIVVEQSKKTVQAASEQQAQQTVQRVVEQEVRAALARDPLVERMMNLVGSGPMRDAYIHRTYQGERATLALETRFDAHKTSDLHDRLDRLRRRSPTATASPHATALDNTGQPKDR